MRRSLIHLTFLLLFPLHGLAWGATGHQVVADIAARHLNSKAQTAVQDLLGGESMASVSTWMDQIRSQPKYRYTNTWHWVTIPDGMHYDDIEKKPEGDVIEATERMVTILRSDTASRDDKEFALRLLIHLVGDLHQPLHVGNGVDKGGTDMQLRWMKRGSNLHQVWDSGIIEAMGQSREELSISLSTVSPRSRREFERGTPADWAHECMQLRPGIYTMKSGDELGEAYAKAQWDTVTVQLQKAGVRLARLLNVTLG
jgi:hypothetical protein